MSNTGYDDFDGLMDNTGIFGSDTASMDNALTEFDAIRTQPTPQGIQVDMTCRQSKLTQAKGCGMPIRLLIEYPEAVAVKYNVQPHLVFGQMGGVLSKPVEWRYSDDMGAFFPLEKCRCGALCAPHFTPAEAEAHLRVARERGWIDPASEQQLSKIAAQAAQIMRQRGAPQFRR